MDLAVGGERWQGKFLDLCRFFSESHELARPQTDKYRRYNQSEAGKQRTRNYSQGPKRRQIKKAYQEDYAQTPRGRELRAAARQRYLDKKSGR